jgi:glutamate--cysteine ligase
MTATEKSAASVVKSKDDLIEYMAAGCKPESAWRIGTEHEKFGFTIEDKKPIPYDGPRGVRAMLEGLMEFGWKPVYEGDNPIALTFDGQSVTLEPGGQFELSGAPLENLHETCNEVHTHLHQVKAVAEKIGIGFLGAGFHPQARLEDIPIMPKGRYGIMKRYMPTRGTKGLDMMFRTCTVQVNLDFDSEEDMVRKLRVSLALQPIATALFANSPFKEGKPSGYLSYRSTVWTDTDPDRCGMLPFVFEEGMGFERYVDYVLDVPMYFVYRDGQYIDAAGQSFRDFMAGRLPALPGELPVLKDWEDHLSTVFPEVRLKRFLEMRGADGGPWRRLCALPALWVGLLYDRQALDACEALISGWSEEERETLRREVPKTGLKTRAHGTTVHELAREVLAIARGGLKRRARINSFGEDETHFLSALDAIVEEGKTPAEVKLEAYHGRWGESVLPLFDEFAY